MLGLRAFGVQDLCLAGFAVQVSRWFTDRGPFGQAPVLKIPKVFMV